MSVFISVSVKRTLWGVQLPLEAQTTQRYVVVPKCYWLFNMFVSTFMRAVAFSPSSCVQRHKFLWFLEHFCARLQMERNGNHKRTILHCCFYFKFRHIEWMKHSMKVTKENLSTSLPLTRHCTDVVKECTYISLNVFAPSQSDRNWVQSRLMISLLQGCCMACAWFILFIYFFDDIIFCSKSGLYTKSIGASHLALHAASCRLWMLPFSEERFAELRAGIR